MLAHFLLSNWYWVAAAIISGLGLLMLLFQEGHYHFSVSTSEAVLLFNHRHALFFDLRTEEDYAQGTILNAQRVVDRAALSAAVQQTKGRPVVVFCQRGRDAISVVSRLRGEGLDQVFALQGGFVEWQRAALPLTATQKKGE